MSNIVHKVKDALTGHGHSHPNDPSTSSTNHGPHNSNLSNKADPRVDSDLDGKAGTGNYTSSTNAGPHNSNIANKLDPRVDSDRDGSKTAGQGGLPSTAHSTTSGNYGTHSTGSAASGPHNSNLLNKADPRVDSDRDGSNNFGAASGATGASAYGNTGYSGTGTHTGTHTGGLTSGLAGSGAHTGTHTGTHAGGLTGSNTTSTNHGPHDSNLLNKVDPRVDSDRDGSRNYGAATGTTGASAYGSTGTHTGAHTGTHAGGLTGSHGTSSNHGPHDSNLLNQADPRVDSDRDGSRNFGAASGATGASAYGSTTGTHGTHGGLGSHGHSGPGPAANTAGPHNSDLLNKVDPRVDSNLDGSNTLGGNRTNY